MADATLDPRLKTIIAEQLGVDEERVVPGASFADDLDADSLDLVELDYVDRRRVRRRNS